MSFALPASPLRVLGEGMLMIVGRVWDLHTGEALKTLKEHKASVLTIKTE